VSIWPWAGPRSIKRMVDPLERSGPSDAHQVIYQRRDFGLVKAAKFLTAEFPAQRECEFAYVWIASSLDLTSNVRARWLVYNKRPELVLEVVDAQTAAAYERMYSDSPPQFGRCGRRRHGWMMFGYYIKP